MKLELQKSPRDWKKEKSDKGIIEGLRVKCCDKGRWVLSTPGSDSSLWEFSQVPHVFLERGTVGSRAQLCHWSSSTRLGWPMATQRSGLIQGESSWLGRRTDLCMFYLWPPALILKNEILSCTQFIYLFRSKVHQPVAGRWNGSLEGKGPQLSEKEVFNCQNEESKICGRSPGTRIMISFFLPIWGEKSEPLWKFNNSDLSSIA